MVRVAHGLGPYPCLRRDDKRKKLTKALVIKIFKFETNVTFLFIFGFYMFLIYDKITGKRE